MPTLNIINQNGEKVGEIELADSVFNAPVREHLLWEVVNAQLAGRRRGTASSKGRSDVRGSTKKIYRQKGTGRARHGAITSPIFVGGGVTFGPKPRGYDQRVSKKVRQSALRSAISTRAIEEKLVIFEDLQLEEIKTKKVAQMLEKLGVDSGLLVDDISNVTLIKSVRNMPHNKFIAPEGLNVYDILKYDYLIMTAPVAKRVEERLTP